MTTSFKFIFSEDNIRRISIPSVNPSYEEIVQLLEKTYEGNYHPELYLRWLDEDGDKVIVSSQQEWEHMMQSVQERPIKLYVTEGRGNYFKDGPPAQPQYFYEEKKEKVMQDVEVLQRLRNSVPACLQHLFKGDRILPYNIPNWLQEAVSVKRIPESENDVDLDINIPNLFQAMHKQALKYLEDPKNVEYLQQGKALLQDMLTLIPKHAVTLYNLCCVESLLGNVREALATLKNAILEGGYSNYEHMEKDSDLDNIRNTPEYRQLLETLKPKIIAEKKVEAVQPVTPPATPPPTGPSVSVGEIKWKEAIDILKQMGFGDATYFGPKCVVLLERHNGDLTKVITDLLALKG